MDVRVSVATVWDEPVFRNLFQFYLYDFSRFTGWQVTYAGKFFELDLDGCWTSETRHPFLIRADGELAGLAIVDDRAVSELSGDTHVRELSEFFVLAAYRRRGVGMAAALAIFSRFPGKWELRQMARNLDAPPFWRAVLERAAPGRWREQSFDDGRWQGTAHYFDNGASP